MVKAYEFDDAAHLKAWAETMTGREIGASDAECAFNHLAQVGEEEDAVLLQMVLGNA